LFHFDCLRRWFLSSLRHQSLAPSLMALQCLRVGAVEDFLGTGRIVCGAVGN
jgi:hypothetical protein